MSVKEIQKKLKALGIDPGPMDGTMGPLTRGAIKAFQSANGLVPDGIVGPKTTAAMEKASSSGSSGGGKKSDKKATDVREFLQTHFPTFVWAMDHPEIGKILQDAADEEWEPLRIRGALQGTDWWKNTSVTARQAKLDQENDPAEWKRKMDAKKEEIRAAAETMGVSVNNSQLSAISKNALTLGFNPQQLEQAILANSNYNKITLEQIESGKIGGTLSQTENAIESVVDEWLIGMPGSTKMKWIRDIAEGRKTVDSLRSYAETVAKKNMPYIADLIDSGLTAREALRPYQDTISEVLERPSSAVDLMDERVQRALKDEEGGLASISKIKENTRREFFDEWNRTQGAQQSATQMVNEVATIFGKRA